MQSVSRFMAELIEAFLETFPKTRQLIAKDEQDQIARLRGELRK
jgi:hypothetical protein